VQAPPSPTLSRPSAAPSRLEGAKALAVAPPEASAPPLSTTRPSLQAPPAPSLARPGATPAGRLEGAKALAVAPAGAAPAVGAAPVAGQGAAGQAAAGQPSRNPGPPAGTQGPALAGAPGGAAGTQGGGGHPGCAPEDLILLTPAERERCRNAIETQNANRTRNAAGPGRYVQAARETGPVDGIAPDKRAYFDAVVAARAAVRPDGAGGKAPGLACNLSALFGGPAGLPAEKIKIPMLPCVIIPPTGVLTEESRLTPP
jgi:hypothetical protein